MVKLYDYLKFKINAKDINDSAEHRLLNLSSCQLSMPLTTPSYFIVFLLGSAAFLNYPCNGLPLTYHPAHPLFPSCLISLLLNLSLAECHKAPFWALSFLICTSPLLVLSLVSLPSHTSFMQMILNSSSLSLPKTFLLLSPT